ncbi:hypothetical protein [Pseudoxanthomonas sacheonensis]|uniref:hypothetical protein n=1 Tax=Pseudoxanthomonas sacheonensis TaxID=443615 RepID=UPI0013D692D2|nr:hypothetical protein [Pseudoxanthomonas sacheonensis]KAF1712772.1 hypothetical protein CSC73_00310 [Pseudoxanthomonas sacheonensis]
MDGFWFQSSMFDIEPGEDQEINPRMYGRQLANWLKEQLELRGYDVEPVINEDWGRCLMCSRDPFMLWVGCGNVTDYSTAQESDPPPPKEHIFWHCFAVAEIPLLKRLFNKSDTGPALLKLNADLSDILSSDPRIVITEEP